MYCTCVLTLYRSVVANRMLKKGYLAVPAKPSHMYAPLASYILYICYVHNLSFEVLVKPANGMAHCIFTKHVDV